MCFPRASRHNGVHFFDIATSKSVRTLSVFDILTSKCASRHNGVHFFDILASKSGPDLVCFVHFHFEMRFAPQRRALFRHLNFQKWSERGVFCTFWLGNVLRATTACTFSTSQLFKALRSWGVLYILTSKCASRHNGVQFFISHLASWLRTRRFSEPEPQIIGKTQCFATFLPFHASASSFFSALLSSNLSLLSASSLLCFSSVHIVGSLTSKLPSIKFKNSKIEDVSQNCFVLDVVKFKKVKKSRRIVSFLTLSSSNIEESLIELLRFWRCQVQNLRTSRRIVSLLSLQIGK